MSVFLNKQTFNAQPKTSFVVGDVNSNILFGIASGSSSISGTQNIGWGTNTLNAATTAASNICVGTFTNFTLTTSANNIRFGMNQFPAGNNPWTGNSNIGFGQSVFASSSILSGSYNLALGTSSLQSLSSGSYSIGLGISAGSANSNGSYTTFIGESTAASSNWSNSTAISNVALLTAANQIMMGKSTYYAYFPGTTSNGSAQFAGALNPQTAQSTMNGSVSGSVVYSQPFGGTIPSSVYKKVLIHVNALNGTSVQYSFPAAFSNLPQSLFDPNLSGVTLVGLSTVHVSVTGSGTSSGFIILEGY